MKGEAAIKAINPKASVIMLPPSALHVPTTKGRINVAVSGPHTDPPASKEVAVNIFGDMNINMSDML